VLCGDNATILRELPANSVDVVVTSPSYWGLRRYLKDEWLGGDPACAHKSGGRGGSEPRSKHLAMRPDGPHRGGGDTCVNCGAVLAESKELGREALHDCGGCLTGNRCGVCFVCKLTAVFDEVRRVLKPTGVLWVNLADSYAANRSYQVDGTKQVDDSQPDAGARVPVGLKSGDLCGIPWRFALSMQAAGWWLRDSVIWAKAQEGEDAGGSAMPGSMDGWRWEKHRVKVGSESKRDRIAVVAAGENVGMRNHSGNNYEQEVKWQDCPGCPVCSPHDGLILRKGSWRHTSAYEFVFMFTKSDDYACDKQGAVEADTGQRGAAANFRRTTKDAVHPNQSVAQHRLERDDTESTGSRNPRNVWNLSRAGDGKWLYCKSCGRFYESASGLTAVCGNEKRDRDNAVTWRCDGYGKTAMHRVPDGKSKLGRLECPTCHGKAKKTLCLCGKTDGWLAHFATFPSSLVERCLRPIPRQVCGKCGEPWARVIADGERRVTAAMKVAGCNSDGEYHGENRADYTGSGAQPASDTKKRILETMAHGKTTLGFLPTCDCHAEPVPATVLDVFSGTATTGKVALKMGFRYIGIELSPDYTKLSEARLGSATPLFDTERTPYESL